MNGRRSGAVVLAAAILAGCGGGGGHGRRDAVNAYITKVDVTVSGLVGERAQIDAALQGFSAASPRPAAVARLRLAQRELTTAAGKLRALAPPPADAAKLHGALVRLLDLEARTIGDLIWTARYVPQLTRTLQGLAAPGTALARELKASKSWAASSVAYGHYRDALAPTAARLDRLSAPSELRPELLEQRRQLRARIALAGKLSDGLLAKDVKAVNAALQGFAQLTSNAAVLRAHANQVAAAKAFNGRLDAISTLTIEIARERNSLVKRLG